MTPLYPLKFAPIFKEKLWGGEKLRTALGKDFAPLSNAGESWEISGVTGNTSIVREGLLLGRSLSELIREYKGDLVGQRVYKRYGDEFPLLIKFLDANDDLSIQVHPDDSLARARHNSLGKTEMWYIMDADPGSRLIAGFNQDMDRKSYMRHLEKGTLPEILNVEEVKAGDVYFLPAGRVHNIGRGILLAEIQQTSDVTYRIYDFDRVDAQGRKRELHNEQALDAIDYKKHDSYKTTYKPKKNEAVPLVESAYFTTKMIHADEPVRRDYASLDSFVIYLCTEGAAQIAYKGGATSLVKGETLLVPAANHQTEIRPKGSVKLLETHPPAA